MLWLSEDSLVKETRLVDDCSELCIFEHCSELCIFEDWPRPISRKSAAFSRIVDAMPGNGNLLGPAASSQQSLADGRLSVDARSVCRMHAVRERTSQRDRELGRPEAQNLQGRRFGQHFDFPDNAQRQQEPIAALAAEPDARAASPHHHARAASPHHRFGCVSSSLARAGES